MLKKMMGLVLLALLASTSVEAQLQKILHQTFKAEGAQAVKLDIVGELVVEPWAGNLIMTETNIVLENASPGIMKHFVEMGRYEIVQHQTEGSTEITLVSKDKVRPKIKSKRGEFKEEVQVRVFMPEFFQQSTDSVWVRRVEITDTLAPKPEGGR